MQFAQAFQQFEQFEEHFGAHFGDHFGEHFDEHFRRAVRLARLDDLPEIVDKEIRALETNMSEHKETVQHTFASTTVKIEEHKELVQRTFTATTVKIEDKFGDLHTNLEHAILAEHDRVTRKFDDLADVVDKDHATI